MATQDKKIPKKVKVKKRPQAEEKPAKNEVLDDPEAEGGQQRSGAKKKVKVKTKNGEKSTPKLKKTVDSDKDIDERILGLTLEQEINPERDLKPEMIEERDKRIYYLTGIGTQHPVHELTQNLRSLLLSSGFNELENSYFLMEKDIFKQYKIKSSLLLEETYHLAENQRQPLEFKEDQLAQLRNVKPHQIFNLAKFDEIISDYNNNKISHTQIFQRLKSELNYTNSEINEIIEILPQLKNIQLKPTQIALRSGMGQSWFKTLVAIMDKDNLPIKIFSTGIWFKRQPKLDEFHLRTHYGASCIIMDDEISLNNGKVIIEEILDRLGFKDIQFVNQEKQSGFDYKYKELAVLKDDIKIAACGMFSKVILSKFGIDIPVLYINFGLEHMVMVQKGIEDIRELMYPQFYKAWKLNDIDIAKAVQFIHVPKTDIGKKIASNLQAILEANYNTQSPCEFTIWEGVVRPDKGEIWSNATEGANVDTNSQTALGSVGNAVINDTPETGVNRGKEITEPANGISSGGIDNDTKAEPTENLGDKVNDEGKAIEQQEGAIDSETDGNKNNSNKSEKHLVVKVTKKEKDAKLCGPALFNEIVVKNGDIFGVQNVDQNPEYSDAVKTNIRYLDAFSKYIGSQIETELLEGSKESEGQKGLEGSEEIDDNIHEIRIGIIKEMEDINLQLDGRAVRYILTNNKKINVRGPMFVNVECKVGQVGEQLRNAKTD